MSRFWSSNNLSETSFSAVQAEVVGAEAKSQIAEARRKRYAAFQELIGIEKLFELRRRRVRHFKKYSGCRSQSGQERYERLRRRSQADQSRQSTNSRRISVMVGEERTCTQNGEESSW
jgi:hypothetical protein